MNSIRALGAIFTYMNQPGRAASSKNYFPGILLPQHSYMKHSSPTLSKS